jgi:hypothetical protein
VVGSDITLTQAASEQLNELRKELEQQQERIQQIEQKLKLLEDEQGVAQEQYLGLLGELRDRVTLDVYATLEFENFEQHDSVFDARNIELLLDIRASQRFRLFGEIEFERVAKTSAGDRQGEVEVEQGWIEYGINRYINPRFGVILVPFGRFNLEHFDTYQDLTDRPIMARRVIPITWAEAGAGFVGSIYLGDLFSSAWLQDFELSYELYAVNGLTNQISDTSSRDARGAFGSDNNNNKALVGRMQISPVPQLQLGLSGYRGKYDRNNDIQGYDVDAKIVLGPLELVGEFAEFYLDDGLNDEGEAISENLRGGYVEGRLHFWPAFLNKTFLGRGLDSPTFTVVMRAGYAEIEDDGDADKRDNREERLTFGLNYRPIESLVFKVEYQNNDTDNEPLERGDNDGFIASVSAAF